MKKYTVTFIPKGIAPAGKLGLADFFGYRIEAVDAADAIDAARICFDANFPELSDYYVAGHVET